jgi:hypothetical protein
VKSSGDPVILFWGFHGIPIMEIKKPLNNSSIFYPVEFSQL